jgi:hypothetical protein
MASDGEKSEGAAVVSFGGPQPGTAFALGWLMAQVYGSSSLWQEQESAAALPAVAELSRAERVNVAFAQMKFLARPFGDCGVENAQQIYATQPESLKTRLREVHSQILQTLSPDPAQLSAYQLGRALSDTCVLPATSDDGTVFLQQFQRDRLATLHSWLTQAGPVLPHESAEVAARSLQNWQDWADVNATRVTAGTNWADNKARIADALDNQGRAWRALLTSPPATGLPGMNAWMRAGESVVRTTKSLSRKILLHFWPLVLLILAVMGGLLYLAITYAHGVAKYWTSLVTLVGGFGVSVAGLRAAGQNAAQGIQQEVWNAATMVARAWDVTWLPTLAPTLRDRYRLFRRGVAPPRIKKGIEAALAPEVNAPAPTAGRS